MGEAPQNREALDQALWVQATQEEEEEMIPADLHEKTVDELQDIAAEMEISGRSSMVKDELIAAIEEHQASVDAISSPAELEARGVSPSATDDERIVELERRMAKLEDQLHALDNRTRPSSQILGSQIGGQDE